jgi:hypothetical protein
MTAVDDLPDDIELSCDADKMVTALTISITCRRCWQSFSGNYRESHAAYADHERTAHPAADLTDYTDRDTAIRAIREALKERSGRPWSVRGGRGTAYGWIHISAPPRRMEGMWMSAEDSAELMRLLGRDLAATGRERIQQITVPDSGDHRREYVALAQGREPEVIGQRYWD